MVASAVVVVVVAVVGAVASAAAFVAWMKPAGAPQADLFAGQTVGVLRLGSASCYVAAAVSQLVAEEMGDQTVGSLGAASSGVAASGAGSQLVEGGSLEAESTGRRLGKPAAGVPV